MVGSQTTETEHSTRQRGPRALAVTAVVASSLLVYALTLAPDVGWGDAAELALQATQLGVTHPPGYPVHTLIGKLFTCLFEEPAVGTNALSAVSASAAAGVLAWLIARLTGDTGAALVGGLLFAFIPPIWSSATSTEVYALSLLMLSLALALLLAWQRRPSPQRLWAAALAYGVSLGSHPANLLLAPAFLYLLNQHVLHQHKDRRARRIAGFLTVAGAVVALFIVWEAIRAQTLPPLGATYLPTTPLGVARFVTGAQYEPVAVQTVSFYAKRATEQALAFGRSVLWIGVPLALLGLHNLWRRQRAVGIALVLVFAIDALYFTGYAATDYDTMLAPAYFVLALWVGCGLHAVSAGIQRLAARLSRQLGLVALLLGAVGLVLALASDALGLGRDAGLGPTQLLVACAALGIVLIGWALRTLEDPRWLAQTGVRLVIGALALSLPYALLVAQFADRYVATQRRDVTYYAAVSMQAFPEDAVVCAAWDRLTPLLYVQAVHGLRPDVTLVERTLERGPAPRTYTCGVVEDWRAYLATAMRSRPTVVDARPFGASTRYQDVALPHGWHLIVPRPPGENAVTDVVPR